MCNSDCAGGESRGRISLSISRLTLKRFFFFFFALSLGLESADVVPK